MSKPLDLAIDAVENATNEQEKNFKRYKPVLDKKLKELEQADKWIGHFENEVKRFERKKQMLLKDMNELLDSAMVSLHTLDNGYTVKPDNKYKVEVEDVAAFLSWLKTNKTPSEVIEFFKNALKIANLKDFCSREMNFQRENGELDPSIDGVNLGKLTYRKLKTEYKKQSNNGPAMRPLITSSRTQRKIKK